MLQNDASCFVVASALRRLISFFFLSFRFDVVGCFVFERISLLIPTHTRGLQGKRRRSFIL